MSTKHRVRRKHTLFPCQHESISIYNSKSISNINVSEDAGWAICSSPGWRAVLHLLYLLVFKTVHCWTGEKVNLCFHADLSLVTRRGAKRRLVNIYRLITAGLIRTSVFLCQFCTSPSSPLIFCLPPRLWIIGPLSLSTSLILVFPSSRLICSPSLPSLYDSI